MNVTGEVQQHLGGGRVRCVALGGSTDGMAPRNGCGTDTGASGLCTRGKRNHSGRVFNVLGEPEIDGRGPKSNTDERWAIHRQATIAGRPECRRQSLFETGIKVVDLLTLRLCVVVKRDCSVERVWVRP